VAKRLPEILARYRELTEKLADPEVATDQARVREIVKERGLIERTAKLCEQYLDVRKQVVEAQEMAADPDEEVQAMANEELVELQKAQDVVVARLADEMGADEADRADSVIIEVRPGTGGDEAALFARDLFEMYRRFAEIQRFKTEVLDLQVTELGGLREATFSLSGRGIYRQLKFESGGHRVQRVPSTETQGRVHTSAATVAVLPEVPEIDIALKDEDVKIDKMRAGGPGGQKVNKTESAIRLTHIPSGIVVKCQDEKSQHKNLARAMRILKGRLFDKMRQERDDERAATRRSQIGSGDRSERIRTYNFPQDRLTDHRLGFNLHGLPNIMLGRLEPVIEALRERERVERLESLDLSELEELE